jgi:hypothetical protein
LAWTFALAALVFVAWVIPVRDQCWDAASPGSTKVAVSRDASGCILHLRTGEVSIGSDECAHLRCEPGIASVFRHVRLGLLAALLGLSAVSTVVGAARWRALLGFAGVDLPLWHVWRVTIEAGAGGVLLPGGLGGDALRVVSVVAMPASAGQPRAPASVVVA